MATKLIIYMTKQEALNKLEQMTDNEFKKFFDKLPSRVQLLVRSGMVNWRKVLPEWYINNPF
jgi:hypothetical protein